MESSWSEEMMTVQASSLGYRGLSASADSGCGAVLAAAANIILERFSTVSLAHQK